MTEVMSRLAETCLFVECHHFLKKVSTSHIGWHPVWCKCVNIPERDCDVLFSISGPTGWWGASSEGDLCGFYSVWKNDWPWPNAATLSWFHSSFFPSTRHLLVKLCHDSWWGITEAFATCFCSRQNSCIFWKVGNQAGVRLDWSSCSAMALRCIYTPWFLLKFIKYRLKENTLVLLLAPSLLL